jgi:hypothetical protein
MIMQNKDDRNAVENPVLREALDRIEKEREGRCAFPFWGNWGNWRNWSNWGNWRNWRNWHNGWRNGW